MVAEHAEVAQAFGLRLPDGHRGGWRGGFETDGEEHHLAIRIVPCNLQGIQGGIHHAHIATRGLHLQQALAAAARHPQHVTVAAQDDILFFDQLNDVVDAPHG